MKLPPSPVFFAFFSTTGGVLFNKDRRTLFHLCGCKEYLTSWLSPNCIGLHECDWIPIKLLFLKLNAASLDRIDLHTKKAPLGLNFQFQWKLYASPRCSKPIHFEISLFLVQNGPEVITSPKLGTASCVLPSQWNRVGVLSGPYPFSSEIPTDAPIVEWPTSCPQFICPIPRYPFSRLFVCVFKQKQDCQWKEPAIWCLVTDYNWFLST